MARFSSVANGEAPATEAQILETRLAVARLLHRAGDRRASYRAFRDIEATSSDPETLAQCAVSRVGLALELAESGIGDMEEVRRIAREAFASVTGSSASQIQCRATIELMHLETYARQSEPDFATAALLGEEFIERYQAHGDAAPMRELGAAMFQTGMFHRRAGNPERAMEYYGRAISEIPHDAPQFGHVDPHSQALLGLANMAWDQGDRILSEEIMTDILRHFPEGEAARRVRERYPALEIRAMAPPAETAPQGSVEE